jgi:transposase-like protein
MTQEAAICRHAAPRAIDEWNQFMFEKIEERRGTAGVGLPRCSRRREITRAQRHVVGGTMAHIDDDHWAHPLRIDVVLLNEHHEREVPAVQNVQHRIGLARLRIACRQGNEEFVSLPDLRGCQCALLSVGKAYRRLGYLRPGKNRSQEEKENANLRMALHNGSIEKLSGHVEADETFIGGKARNMHVAERKRRITGTGGKDKTAVMGIVQRGGKVKTVVVPNRKKSALQAEVRKHVEAGSALYTDALLSYQGLEADYAHAVIDHAVAYVDGNVHTNTLENFWALLKRGISGTYVSVEPFHLFRYLDEQAYRYNNRKEMSDYDRFEAAASQIVGKRLTWNEVTGKNHEPQMCRPN